MNKNIKSMFFVSLILLLLVGVSSVSATDDNVTTDLSSEIPTAATDNIEDSIIEDTTNNKIIKDTNNNLVKENKNLKTDGSTHYIYNVEDWDELFTDNYLISDYESPYNLIFCGDVITTDSSYIINQPVNIIGNNHYLKVTTSTNNKQSLNFVSGASGSNITDLKFLNTQVFVNTTENIVFDNITAENSQTGLGQGTGSFAIRDGSINITIKNSDFITTSNGGYSTLVLTWAKDCTIDNNTITGTGNVGNLVYLNNYGGSTNANGITKNSHNTISNNTITATNNGVFCYSLSISGPNNTIINNEISNGYMYAVTTIWAGSYDTETDPEDTHNVSYHGNKYINNTITGRFSTGNYSEVINNTINGISTIVGHADVTGNEFLNTVTLSNDINFKENDASTVTVNVILPNCQFKDNNISVLTISSNAEPTYNYGGNDIGTINGNFETPATASNSNSQSESNTNILTKNTTNLKRATPTDKNVDYYYGTWIDDDTWEVNVTEDNFDAIFPGGKFSKAPSNNKQWYKNIRYHKVIVNYYYIPPDKELDITMYANVTVHFKNNVSIQNELYTTDLHSQGNFYSDGNITITCDEDYFWQEFDEFGYVTEGHGLDLLRFTGNATVKNLVYNINITEEMLDVGNLNYDNYYSAVNGDNITFEDCTFNIQLPRNIKVNQNGFDKVNYTVQLLGSDTEIGGDLHKNKSGNFNIVNCTFNINSTADNEEEYPYLFTNLGLADNQSVIFRNNTLNLNNMRGIQLATDNGIVEGNTINTNYDYAVELVGNSNIVKNNVLIAKELKGNDAVLVTGENNVVQNNGPTEEQAEPTLIIDTTEFTANTNTTISASIYAGEEKMENITKGKVIFKVNGKTLKDENGKVIYAKVVNGTATIENYMIPDSWNEGSTIQAVYSGSTECDKITSEKVNITINKEEPTFTTESVTAKAGDKITLKATITDGKVINTGKVVFKINGKTVKDENGKVIYAKVVNNTVNVEYTIPDSFNVKDYNITAVFIAPGYNSLENTKTLTITE